MRIAAQFIDASTGTYIWTDRHDREVDDNFAVQDEVTTEILNALKIRLGLAERANIANDGTTNLDAHGNFMRMRDLLFHSGMDAQVCQEAVSRGENAIEQDPGHAQAYAILSLLQLLDYHNQWFGQDDEIPPKNASSGFYDFPLRGLIWLVLASILQAQLLLKSICFVHVINAI